MASESPCCPDCGRLMTRVADHLVRYRCPACQGQMLGLAPFERLLEPGMGARIWVASAGGEPGHNCPLCHRPSRLVPPAADSPPGIALCRTCEQVWLPAQAEPWMAQHAPESARSESARSESARSEFARSEFARSEFARTGGHPSLPSQCEECGAPWEPDRRGCCPYCHAQLTAPALSLFEPEAPPSSEDNLVSTVIGLFDRGHRPWD